jgi:CRP-like cAMP-binding protein
MAAEGGPGGPLRHGMAASERRPPVAGPPQLLLTEEQIGLLRREGDVRPVAAGEVLFREGDRSYDFIVILAGRVAIGITRPGPNGHWRAGGQGTSSLS